MSISIGIVDYQMGNLRSVQKAIEHVGFQATISSDPAVLSQVSHLLLPGVGAFRDAIAELRRRDLVSFLRDWTDADRPFLGICLGMQLLFDRSFEGGEYEGLHILPGEVVRFDFEQLENLSHESIPSPPYSFDVAVQTAVQTIPPDASYKVPHMGWNQVHSTYPNDSMLQGIEGDPFFYFVHSYYVVPENPSTTWLKCDYGVEFCAAVRRGQTFATQFHPEKSQRDGLQLLRNFIEQTR